MRDEAALVDAADRIEIVLNLISRERLDNRCTPIQLSALRACRAAPSGVRHVMEAIEDSDEIQLRVVG